MNRMDQYVKKGKEMLFIPFITAGDPTEEATIELAYMLQNAGAAAIELGVPYSDPLADGPVIRRASQRALKRGMNLRRSLEMGRRIRQRGVQVPLIIFTYCNPLLQLGTDRFFREAAENKIDGLLVPDLPFEESRGLAKLCRAHDVRLISLVAPTTSDGRLRAIGAAAQGFLYCVSSLGVTGVRQHFHPHIFSFLRRAGEAANIPIAVGFGISSSEQVEELSPYADGFIVGSAIVDRVEHYADRLSDEATRPEAVEAVRKELEAHLLGHVCRSDAAPSGRTS